MTGRASWSMRFRRGWWRWSRRVGYFQLKVFAVMLQKLLCVSLVVVLAAAPGFADDICFNKASGRRAEQAVWDNIKPAKVIERTDDAIQSIAPGRSDGQTIIWDQLGFLPLARGMTAPSLGLVWTIAWEWAPDLPQSRDLVVGYMFQSSATQTRMDNGKPIETKYEINAEVVGSQSISFQGCDYEVVIIDLRKTSLNGNQVWEKYWLDLFNLVPFKIERFNTEEHWNMHFADTTTKLVRLR